MKITNRKAIICCSIIFLLTIVVYADALKVYANITSPDEIVASPEEIPAIYTLPSSTPKQIIIEIEGPTPTPSPTPSPIPTPTPVPTPSGLLGGRYDGFSEDEEIITDNMYANQSIRIDVYSGEDKSRTEYADYFTYYVADIHIQNIEDFRTASAGTSFKSLEASYPNSIGKRMNAILAVTGDYYVDNKGLLIRNGELYKNYKGKYDICVLYRNGTIKTYTPDDYETDAIIAENPWQVWSFGPSLLNNDGTPKTEWGNSQITSRNPRCILGYYEPGHYSLVVIDGRQSKYSMGLTLNDLSLFCYNMGFSVAYNMDGGKTAAMCWQGNLFSHPENGGRSVSDIIYFCKENTEKN